MPEIFWASKSWSYFSFKILTKLQSSSELTNIAHFPYHQVTTILISQTPVKQAQKRGSISESVTRVDNAWTRAAHKNLFDCHTISELQDYKCEMCFASKVTSKGRKARRDPTIVQERVSCNWGEIFSGKNLSLEKMLYLNNYFYNLDMFTNIIKCYHDQVQQAMLEEEEKIMAPTLVPVMSHIK